MQRKDLVFLAVGAVFAAWTAFHPQSLVRILFWTRLDSLPPGNVWLVRFIAVLGLVGCALSLFVYLLVGR